MDAEREQMLSEVFIDVVEKLAFMFGEPADEDDNTDPEGASVLTSMGFKGPFEGKLALAVPRAMCNELAANVLGTDEDDEASMAIAIDTLKELLNVVCGNVLTAIAGEEPVFDLTVPEFVDVDLATWQKLKKSPNTLVFLIDDYPALLHLSTS